MILAVAFFVVGVIGFAIAGYFLYRYVQNERQKKWRRVESRRGRVVDGDVSYSRGTER